MKLFCLFSMVLTSSIAFSGSFGTISVKYAPETENDPSVTVLRPGIAEELAMSFKGLQTLHAKIWKADSEIRNLLRTPIYENDAVLIRLGSGPQFADIRAPLLIGRREFEQGRRVAQEAALRLSEIAKGFIHAYDELDEKGHEFFFEGPGTVGYFRYHNQPYFRSNYYNVILEWLERPLAQSKQDQVVLTGLDFLKRGEGTDLTPEEYNRLMEARDKIAQNNPTVLQPLSYKEWKVLHGIRPVFQFRRDLEYDRFDRDKKTAVVLHWPKTNHSLLIYPYSPYVTEGTFRYARNTDRHNIFKLESDKPFNEEVLAHMILSDVAISPPGQFLGETGIDCQEYLDQEYGKETVHVHGGER